MNNPQLLRFDNTLLHDPAIDQWLHTRPDDLRAIAQQWLEVMRACGDEVRELFHDGCANACLGEFPFAYVNVFTAHVNVGFFQGASLPDPAHLLQGTGRFMRYIKLKPGASTNGADLTTLIQTAYARIKSSIENG